MAGSLGSSLVPLVNKLQDIFAQARRGAVGGRARRVASPGMWALG